MAKSARRPAIVTSEEMERLRRDFKKRYGSTKILDDFYDELVRRVREQFIKDMIEVLYGGRKY